MEVKNSGVNEFFYPRYNSLERALIANDGFGNACATEGNRGDGGRNIGQNLTNESYSKEVVLVVAKLAESLILLACFTNTCGGNSSSSFKSVKLQYLAMTSIRTCGIVSWMIR